MNAFTITPSGQACGARVEGVDLSRPLGDALLQAVRAAWLEHHVLAFPHQSLTHDQLEAVAEQFGALGEDPFFNPLPGRKHIAAVRREAQDTNPIFAEYWHSDWSFMPEPPQGTLLYSIEVPPQGGDTHFANQHLAYESMPQDMRARFEDLRAIHSPAKGYSLEGAYGDVTKNGAMDIRPSAEAATMRHTHPLVPAHPETGRRGFFSGISYIVGFEGVEQDAAQDLIFELHAWQSKEEFLYCHQWENDMLVLWDNRSVVHKATGGYEGFRRELHRVTVY
ncbi:MAG: TauD/TfdA family dioxygenase [Pseudomonadota bacterium]